jgi:CubicO group peptidase (beta-lactamase class C family)
MKAVKRIFLIILVFSLIVVIMNYPKLNIIAGYSAKYTASSVFVGGRSLIFTDSTDTSFSPVNLATNKVDFKNKTALASVFGLLTRKAVYRKGLGAILADHGNTAKGSYLVPKRAAIDKITPFPYGSGTQIDSVFGNIDYKSLDRTVASIFGKEKTRAVLVLYKDQIIAEKYGLGFHKDSRILGWSMAKSLMSTIFGVLQQQNKLDILDRAPIDSWQNDRRKNILIHNLLQMNSGLEWDENYDEISDATKMLFLERDMAQMQEDKLLTGITNASWNYSSGTSNLLSKILRKQFDTHQKYLDFWYSDFIDKIGMDSMVIEADLAGNYVASSYAWATARDWAKFGLLYLHNGNWNGEQLFSKDWVSYITTPTPTSNGSYGAQFWLNSKHQLKDVPTNMYFADGYQGQRVYVLPDQDLVVVRLGLSGFDENLFLKGVIKSIE